ncbi:MAG TPA: hypothetical protein DCY86_05035 [Bdellovibrionales bacterium]|nr:hypothetical protein [Bdellovibrionales bacterium]
MARHEIIMPQMGESITTGTITKWRKKVGDPIDVDEILLDISTDKVESEIPSPYKGRIVAFLYKEGDTVDVNKKIAEVDDDMSAKVEAAPAAAAEPKIVVEEKIAKVAKKEEVKNEAKDARRFYTPLVQAMAKEASVPLEELVQVKGTGTGGRVSKADFEQYLKARESAPAPTKVSGRVEVVVMDNMRKAIARNMVESKLTSPHVNSISEVDLTHLVKFRESFKAEFQKQEGFNLTYSPFILYAIIQALKEHPLVNASLEGDKIMIKKDINLGCAVAVPGHGLIVPVIKNADNLNMLGLCRMLNTLATKARARKLVMDDLSGGTFTFTNVGSFGTLLATPVILQPQLGIYAAGMIAKRVVVLPEDVIAIRSMMYGTHTYDHRVIDGELGGKFLETVHKHLSTMDAKAFF